MSFDVIVTNVYGAVTSSVATLNVTVIPPFVATDTTPGQGDGSTNVYAFANGSVTFSAAFAGPLPISTQWKADTGSGYADIPGATNGSVTVTNLQSSNDGNYMDHASNAYGSGDSSPAPLTVLADPAPPSVSEPYAYAIFTNHPVAYWRFNETTLDVVTNSVQAYDYSGHNLNATYGHGTAVFDNGLNSSSFPGFESGNPSVSLLNSFDGSSLTAPSLNLNTNTVTISMWINPNAVVGTYWGLFMWANGSDKAGFGFGGTQATNSSGFAVAELGYTWNTNSSATYNFNSNLYPPAEQWSFVSLVITPTNSTIYLYYTDGSGTHVSRAVQSIANSPESFNGGTIWIGSDGYSGRNFDGYIDEVSVFNRSLSETEIQKLFQVGSGVTGGTPFITSDVNPTNVNTFAGLPLKLTADGDGMPVPTYQWQAGTGGMFTNLVNGGGVSGVNSSTLTMAAPTAADSLNYRLLLSNTYGYATSSICPVALSPVPTNGLWTACYQVTNSDNNAGYVHASGLYTGEGVLGHGGFWNVIPGAGLYGYTSYTSASDYTDNGSMHSGITCSISSSAQSWVVGQAYPHDSVGAMFGQFVSFNSTNTVTNAIVLSGIPDGTYNLAFHSINGQTSSHGATFTAHGVNGDQSASTVNHQSQFFRDGDTTVIITNVMASGGTLNVDVKANNTNNSADVNGIEIQLVSYAPVTAGFSVMSTNVFETQPVTFADASTGGTNWFWDFGDGNTLNSQTRGATHVYAATGNYTVIQTVKGPGGTASATNSVDIQVLPKPSIGSVTMSAGSLVLNGTGGISGQQYRILTSTNVALPLSSWTTMETGAFAADGSYSYTNSTPTNQASFFILVSP
jgi:PKD repeat protein